MMQSSIDLLDCHFFENDDLEKNMKPEQNQGVSEIVCTVPSKDDVNDLLNRRVAKPLPGR
jgi:hypothetical protein